MAHINKQIDFTVEIFLVYKNSVLLRKHEKYGIWLGVGGHIELHEDPNQAALREVKEEVGMEIQIYDTSSIPNRNNLEDQELIPPLFMNRHRINDTHEHIALIYFAKAPTDKISQLVEAEKTSDIGWYTKEEIMNSLDIQKRIKVYALKALEVVT